MKAEKLIFRALGVWLFFFASQVQSQSQVTLYGTVDVGLAKLSGQAWGMNDGLMNNVSSLIGLRGQEDMGGGWLAGFHYETALSPRDGHTWQWGSGFWGLANVWVQGPWGQLRMGRAPSPTYQMIELLDLTWAANYSVIGNTYAYSGFAWSAADDMQPAAYNNSIWIYRTPAASSWSCEVAWVMKHDHGGHAKHDMACRWQWGQTTVVVANNKTRGWPANQFAGLSHDFGPVLLSGSYSRSHDLKQRQRSGFSLGAQMRHKHMSWILDVTQDVKNHWHQHQSKKTNLLLQAQLNLSPRSYVYAAFLRLDGGNNVGVGLQHNF